MEARIRTFYERYGKVVLGRAHAVLGDRNAAKETLHDVFLRVITSDAHVLEEPSPTTWLYRVTTNLSLDRLRGEKRREELLMIEWDQTERYAPGVAADDLECRAIVRQILDAVPPEMQEIAIYRFLDEMTHKEIADLVGISARTVGNRLAAFKHLMKVVPRRRKP